MKKVLVVTYYWPPAGGPGVQRVLKFAKYLPALGWQPIVLTVKNGEYPSLDYSLAKDIPKQCKVYRTSSWEPGALYRRFVGMRSSDAIPVSTVAQEALGWRRRAANWIRLNLFVPDAKVGWLPSAVRAGQRIIAREKPQIIFSSAPPSTVHLIAEKLAGWSNLKWVADFRDPWTRIYHYDRAHRLACVQRRDKALEERIVKRADARISVSKACAQLLGEDEYGAGFHLLPNGFDEEDFENLGAVEPFKRFTIAYAGNMTTQQNPANLWDSIRNLADRDQEFADCLEVKFMGIIDPSVMQALADSNLTRYAKFLGYVDHGRLIRNLKSAHVLLLVIPRAKGNEAIVTGKIFEYMASRNFILGIGPRDGAAAEILDACHCGRMFGFSEGLENILMEMFQLWKDGKRWGVDERALRSYTRRKSTERLVEIFSSALARTIHETA